MPSLLSSLSALLSNHDAPAALAPQVMGSEDDVAVAVQPALARIVDGLARLADDVGPESLAELVDRHDAPLAGELDDFLAEAPTRSGHEILDHTFGAERGLVVIGLASALGLPPSLVGRLLPLLAPLVTAELARRRDARGLDEIDLVAVLQAERTDIERFGLLRGTAFDESGLVEVLPDRRTGMPDPVEVIGPDIDGTESRTCGAFTTLAATVSSGGSAAVSSGGSPTVSSGGSAAVSSGGSPTVSSGGSPTVSSGGSPTVPSGGTSSGTNADEAVPGRAGHGSTDDDGAGDEPASGGVGDDRDPVGDRSTGDDGAGGTLDPSVADDGGAARGDDDRHPGGELPVLIRSVGGPAAALTWLGWAVGAAVLVLLLAWLLSTCAITGAEREAEQATVTLVDLGRVGAGRGGSGLDRGFGPGAGADAGHRLDGGEPVALTAEGPVSEVPEPTSPAPAGPSRFATGISPSASRDNLPVEPGDPARGPVGPVAGRSLNELLGLAQVTFDTASADLTGPGRTAVDQVAAYLSERPELLVEIGGHTDSDGDELENLELSQERADAVLDRLVAAGIDPKRLIAIGHGETEPRVPNHSSANKAMNRRIEFMVR